MINYHPDRFTPKIDPKRKFMWTTALRSSKYPQTTRLLRDKDGFCCLGVACEISGVSKWKEDVDHYYHYYLDSDAELPKQVWWWLKDEEIDPEDYYVRSSDVQILELGVSLAGLNDSGFTFDQIADVIDYFL